MTSKEPNVLHFDSDYMEGAHPAIIERLATTNLSQTPGYGLDPVCESARARIRHACQTPDAAVHFLVGGTQANVAVLDQLLRPWEGVVSADTGHINGHEAGALEAHGHKILPLPHRDGKLLPADVDNLCTAWAEGEAREHEVEPGVVYISQPTEYGTLYSLDELRELRSVCDAHGLRLFIDGARLGYALAALEGELSLPELASAADAFYIGGTKVGALFGEAVVFPDPKLADHFFTLTKKHGALLAKGRMLGLQFDVLFEEDSAAGADADANQTVGVLAGATATAVDGSVAGVGPAAADASAAAGAAYGVDAFPLVPAERTRYLACGRHAVALARRLAEGFRSAGFELAMDSITNQQFVVMDDATCARLREHATFEVWERRADGNLVVRFVTSWATRPEAVEELLALL